MEIPETIAAGPITLQRWTIDRALDLDRVVNESLPELVPFMPWATAEHDFDATVSFLVQAQSEWDSGENFNYAMLAPDSDVVGACGLMSRRGADVLEIGYWVHSALTRRGYATAATLALTQAGLVQPGIDRMEIHRDVNNQRGGS